ncbi:MAG: hypothetical protein GY839_20690 [candidate division Zixibacteria bacterium]|nr:hypothetical protein [candidate division Zixibacteria bacterium]
MVELNAVVDADLKIELDGIASIKTEGSISAGIRNVVYDGFSFADQYEFIADWRIELSDSQAEINRFAFRSADHELLKLSGNINDIYADTLSGALAVQSLSIDLNDYQDEIGKFLTGYVLAGKIDLKSVIEMKFTGDDIMLPCGALTLRDLSLRDSVMGVTEFTGDIVLSADTELNYLNLDFNIGRLEYDTLLFSNISLNATSSYDRKLSPTGTEVQLSAPNVYRGEIQSSLDYSGSGLKGDIKLAGMDISVLTGDEIKGFANATIDFAGSPKELKGRYSIDILDLNISFENDSLLLDSLTLKGNCNTFATEPFGFNIANMEFALGDFIEGEITGRIIDDVPVFFLQAGMEASSIPEFLPAGFISLVGPIDMDGDIVINGALSADTSLEMQLGVNIEPTDILLEDYESLVVSLGAAIDLLSDPQGIVIGLEGDIGELYAENLSSSAYENVIISGDLIQRSTDLWQIENFKIEFPNQKSLLKCHGKMSLGMNYGYDLAIDFDFHAPSAVSLTSEYDGFGDMRARLRLREENDTLSFEGGIDFVDIALRGTDGLELNQIQGSLPVKGMVFMGDSLFVNERNDKPDPFSLYRRSRYSKLGQSQPVSNLIIGSAKIGQFEIDNIEADAAFTDGLLAVDYFEGNWLEGAITGSCRFDLSGMNLFEKKLDFSALEYKINSTFSDINFDVLVSNVKGRGRKKSSEAMIGGNLAFEGTGLPLPGTNYFLEGTLDVTEIGPRTAERLLKFIDPLEENPGIADTRKLMSRKFLFFDTSYKPRWFSFAIRHGNLYPSLYMDQPFYADFLPLMRINMPIRYSRIPLSAALKNILEQGY